MNKAKNEPLRAKLLCYTLPNKEQEKSFLEFIQGKYGEDTALDIVLDESLHGGFQLFVGSEVYDWSNSGRMRQLKEKLHGLHYDSSDVMPMLREGIESFSLAAGKQELGTVITVGDGIATVKGLEGASYGEILVFETGTKGMVQDLQPEAIGCILFGDDDLIGEGCRVTRSGKNAGVPVGNGFLGRVVNALGEPIDGKGSIAEEQQYSVEIPAPSIIDRQPVNEPVETGILAIDSMFPIGRGQRELIIGDRQTGKTAIALDTILNQKGKDMVCIYVAIGQKASSVAQLAETLRRHDAMSYSIIVSAAASESDPMQYIAPYSGCAMAEFFMNQGRDVLIVYDDLSKHAIAYRSISLLLERPPGREAYPGDVFYLHSRLLERSAHLSEEKGGGSITALPIVETLAGDVSAYIPTNIISITDGQIFLENDLFFLGQRPAINVGLSVSRVGGAAQTRAMKSAVGTIRLDLAQYREMEVFTQFSSDLDETTKEQLRYGKGLMQLLRQPQYHPMPLLAQVITLVAATNHIFTDVPVNEIKKFQADLIFHVLSEHKELCTGIETHKVLSEDTKQELIEISREFMAKRYK